MEHHSNIELYYAQPQNCGAEELFIDGEECRHIVKVMRHFKHDELFVTNGQGKIFQSEIGKISDEKITAVIKKTYRYKNEFSNITFCIPKLKNPERFEFALEKCTELGITKFIVFSSERTISKSVKMDRWQKIVLSAMKQSLRSYLPEIKIVDSFDELVRKDAERFVFEQNAENKFNGLQNNFSSEYYFIFGPEGGLSPAELAIIPRNSLYKLSENRLRSETAIVKCASRLG